MKEKLPVKIADIAIILIAAGLTGLSAFMVYARLRNTPQVLIESAAQRWVFPLDADETVVVGGPIGDTIIRIRDNQAWVESSPCDNQTCVAGGHIHQPGQWSACLPNNVLLIIEGNEGSGNAADITTW